jgi:hypothetical protein
MRYKVAAALVYLATLVWFGYRSDGVADWVAILIIFAAPFAAGYVAGVWVLLVPPLAVLFVLPAGDGSGELPIWFVMMFTALVAVPEIVVGWAARWLVTRYASR